MKQRLLLLLAFGLPPLLLLLAAPVPRLDADAVEYYSHLRSLYFDHDLDFANEFEHFGILTRGDKVPLTATGHRRTIFSIGPALLWMPFYAVGDLWARALGAVEEGYSPAHIRAVTLASLCYGVAGLLILHGILLQLASHRVAFWSVFLLEYATFLFWYMTYEPVMSHALSFFVAALVLRLYWDGRGALTWRRALVIGLVIGVSATVRWQNGVLLLLPAFVLLPDLVLRPWDTVRRGLLTLLAFALGASPQMFAWKAIFGSYLLADPPHGRDFLRLDHPYLLETFFSSRHGLLYWTPVLWLGFLGFVPLLRRDRRLALSLGIPLLLMSYVNVCSGDWWAGGSFSNRRFDSVLPLLALGLAMSLALLQRAVARNPWRVLVAGGLVLGLWNFLLMRQYRAPLVPRDDTVAFPQLAENSARLVGDAVGTPLAWPANWIFAKRHRLGPGQYDLMVGKYLFYRQNNLGGVIDLGNPELDIALLGEGWSGARRCGEALCREVEGAARLFAPLDVPEDLQMDLWVAGSGTLRVSVNGRPLAELALTETLGERPLRVAAGFWQRELNEIGLVVSQPGRALVDRLVFTRTARRP